MPKLAKPPQHGLADLTVLPSLNLRHLQYFWLAAKEGSLSAAAARAGLAPQTLSAQIRELESRLGFALLKPQGRKWVLTAAGIEAWKHADRIFEISQQIPSLVREAGSKKRLHFRVGITDGIAKNNAYQALAPVLGQQNLNLRCEEGKFNDLLASLALHQLDVLLSDHAVATHPTLKLNVKRLASFPLAWFGLERFRSHITRDYPQSLTTCPLLLPTEHLSLRAQMEQWFERHELEPQVAGEFEDSALMATFAAQGMGVLAAPEVVAPQLALMGLNKLCPLEGLQEELFILYIDRKTIHPLIEKIAADTF